MISKEFISTKVRDRIGSSKSFIVRNKSSNNKVIYAFKCSKCREILIENNIVI